MGRYRYRVEYVDIRDEYSPVQVTYIAADSVDGMIEQFRYLFDTVFKIIEASRCIDGRDWSKV